VDKSTHGRRDKAGPHATADGRTPDADELELIALAAGGDRDAFGLLARKRWALVHRIAARICGPDEAEDVAQLVFIKLWRQLPRLRIRAEKADRLGADSASALIDRWLVRVTANKAIDSARHIGRRLKLIERRRERTAPTLEERMENGEISRVFSEAAAVIGERQRAAFVLREFEGLGTSEVAEILGVTASTVRNLISQARRGLRRELRKRFPEYAPPREEPE